MPRLFSRRLFRTTAFRAALLYACAFSLLAAFGMGFIYWSTKSHIFAQVDARLALETDVLLNLYRRRAMPALLDTVQRRNNEEDRRIFFYLLWGADRGWTGGEPAKTLDAAGLDGQLQRYATLPLGQVFQVSGADGAKPVRVLSTTLPGNYRLLVGRDLEQEQDLLQHTLTVISLVGLAVVVFALLASLLLGRRALHRIDQISRTAGDIMAGDLSRRLPLRSHERGRDDEFDQLSRKLNAMLERIEELVAGMRQVTDNVAHDLRNPLNRLRNRLEVTLLETRSAEEYRAVIESGIRDADELLKTFNALLSIAQAEAGIKRNQWAPVDLAQLAEDLVDLYQAVAEDAGLVFSWSAQAGLSVPGNRQLLAQALGNLLDNAVKYAPPGGVVTIRVGERDGAPCVSVADNGCGIPPAERERVLHRFVRLDSARHRPGNGLGLSLVSAVAKLHRARLELADNDPGLKISLCFPKTGERF